MMTEWKLRSNRRNGRFSLIIAVFGGTPCVRCTYAESFLASSVAAMNLLPLLWRSMSAMEFVKETTWITQGRLPIWTFTPEHRIVCSAIGASDVTICSNGPSTELVGHMQVAGLASFLSSDDTTFTL